MYVLIYNHREKILNDNDVLISAFETKHQAASALLALMQHNKLHWMLGTEVDSIDDQEYPCYECVEFGIVPTLENCEDIVTSGTRFSLGYPSFMFVEKVGSMQELKDNMLYKVPHAFKFPSKKE